MLAVNGIVFGVAFILGLLCTANPWSWMGLVGLGVGIAICRWQSTRVLHPLLDPLRRGPTTFVWIIAVGLLLFAVGYGHIRSPHPSPKDISHIASQFQTQPTKPDVRVMGKVETLPRLTRSQKTQFRLNATRVSQVPNKSTAITATQVVVGQLYVTLRPELSQDLHPGQTVSVSGFLYRPKSATTPQGFDFSSYLARQGIFAGLKGETVEIQRPGWPWGGWALRRRIVQSQFRWLESPAGPLVSAMVMGGRAVDLPFEIKDAFVQVGLAHALAASGFHVSLVVAAVLTATRRLANTQKLLIGTATLILFGLLSGFAPSVLRAILMGIASLAALAAGRKTKPVGLLLVVAVVLLVLNPLWIWDLGFQLSFLATLGLIVTVPRLIQRLDWLPPTIATLVAVPLAATLWTLPLQLYSFGVVPLYSVIANVITTPLLAAITIGGFISGLAALIWPLAGSALAGVLYYPCHLLLAVVNTVGQLPGQTLALGTISIWQLVLLYGLLLAVWLWPWWQQRWTWAGLVAIALVVLPIWQVQAGRFQVTVFDTANLPMMVVQQPGATVLLNSGDRLTVTQTLIPFLQHQGVNQIDWAIATDLRPELQEGWAELQRRIPIQTFSAVSSHLRPITLNSKVQQLQPQQPVSLGNVEVTLLRFQPAVLQLRIEQHNWLLVSGGAPDQITWLQTAQLPAIQVLWWMGRSVPSELLDTLKPQVVILSARGMRGDAIAQLQQKTPQVYWTARDGSIQWTPGQEFETTLPAEAL